MVGRWRKGWYSKPMNLGIHLAHGQISLEGAVHVGVLGPVQLQVVAVVLEQ
jgi:hypothetical protein